MYKNACRILGLDAGDCKSSLQDDITTRLAEVTRNLSEAEKESLRKILEGVSAEILQKVGIGK